jgi:hypothetical protein
MPLRVIKLLDRLNYMFDWLDTCQQKSGNGYVDGIPNGKAFGDDLASGNTQAVRDRWVSLYNIHKLFAGQISKMTLAFFL